MNKNVKIGEAWIKDETGKDIELRTYSRKPKQDYVTIKMDIPKEWIDNYYIKAHHTKTEVLTLIEDTIGKSSKRAKTEYTNI